MNRTAILIAVLMCAASIGAVVASPGTKTSDLRPAISLKSFLLRQLGERRDELQRMVQTGQSSNTVTAGQAL